MAEREKTDCFAYRGGRCNALTKMVCKERRCSFYKTAEQFDAEREKYGFADMRKVRPGMNTGNTETGK